MAELDYFILAEAGRLEPSGVWSVLGAGFDRVLAPQLPSLQMLAMLGKVTLDDDETEVLLTYTIKAPEGVFALEGEIEARPGPDNRPLPGMPRTCTFLAHGQVPLLVAGRYIVTVQVGDETPHETGFHVMLEAEPPTDPAR